MTYNFIKLANVSVTPQVSWFSHLPLPEGRTYRVTQRLSLSLDAVNTMSGGYESNFYRSTGTDQNNKDALKASISVNGVLVDAQPPFALASSLFLIDGYTRYQALLELGIPNWVFNMVEPKEGFTEQNVRDEIGLGANNHPPSKSAGVDDFKKRLAVWVSNEMSARDELPTLGNCIDWVNAIPHSFTQKQIADFCEKVLKSYLCASTVASYDAVRVRKFAEQNGVGRVVPLNISGNSTYFRRAIFQVLDTLDETAEQPVAPLVGYAPNTLAEEMDQVRKSGQLTIDRYNEIFERAFALRYKDSNFKMFTLKNFVPQITDTEDPNEFITLD